MQHPPPLDYASPSHNPSPTRRRLTATLLLFWCLLDLLATLILFVMLTVGIPMARVTISPQPTAVDLAFFTLALATCALPCWAIFTFVLALALFKNDPGAPAHAHRACRIAEAATYAFTFLLTASFFAAADAEPLSTIWTALGRDTLLLAIPLLPAVTLTRLLTRSLLPRNAP
jgi:hypothetical protein